MSKIIASAAIRGAHKIVERAQEKYEEAVKKFGKDTEVAFPNTAYYLPIIYAMLGYPVKKLGDCGEVLEEAKRLLPPVPTDELWTPYLGPALDAGMATFFAEEIIEAIRYLEDPNFYTKTEEPVNGNIWLGAADDVIFRKRGVEFVDGTAPGFAAILGAPPNKEIAVKIAQELQEKNLYVFMHSDTNGVRMAEQLKEAGVQLGWPTRLVPFGPDTTSVVFAIGFACRVAMAFGGIKPGDYMGNLLYNKDRTFAFAITFGPVSDEWYANGAGAINWGFPVISDWDIPEIKPFGVCTYEHVVSKVPHEEIVDRAIEVRGLKVTTVKLDIPVAYAPAFEGERVRKDDLYLECGGGRTPAVELLISKPLEEVEDGKIEVIGPEINEVEKLGIKGPPYRLPFAVVVEVAGANMQEDFEAILERQFHHLINYAQGIMHVGQRNIMWLRISKAAVEKGFLFKHIGEILYAKMRQEFGAIVDKCQVTIYTEEEKVKEILELAKEVYTRRDERIAGMTDETVDVYYSCTLCQSFAPSHVCVITPERIGMCGAYNWLDGKACYEINPTGPNQPIEKGEVIDEKLGQFSGINEFVKKASRGKVERVSLYSIMVDPMTACGCFECIAAMLPSVNGIMIVNRDYLGMTPSGMKFSTMAGMVGGGQVTPGFMGVSKHYITSRKFLIAEGGLKRVVWMPKMLKEELKDKLKQRAEELGIPDLIDKIADETVASTEQEVKEWVEKVKHPVLEMEPLM
ncbi:acetyl-CoA decarbonylase/synthase complex subunit alpha/beta [Thermosulfurimonas dismutans]|uniref:CO-methylating acetyl-CoA synthase n=1 Tax=Thermosulfurimonas dismutans TaxID=999894 RepID=A0A179D479_9BACT|nr:acetyl-CoA decarbonylase/synthase complex subunit alpha/beta [Thermosulfurimonas dismutans]OAQ20880.1 CO dehydrogenase/acetyl-CoA synthase, acetyl-CoA synthase subunit [Thermosulfurimonas dismutans]